MFSIIGVFWKFRIILFSKVALMSKKILKRRRFPVNTAKFLRTAFSIEHLRWLLLIPPFCSAPKDIVEYPRFLRDHRNIFINIAEKLKTFRSQVAFHYKYYIAFGTSCKAEMWGNCRHSAYNECWEKALICEYFLQNFCCLWNLSLKQLSVWVWYEIMTGPNKYLESWTTAPKFNKSY